MKLHLVAVGTRMPDWVSRGYREYASRLPRECSMNLIEVPAGKRGKGVDLARILRDECERIQSALPPDCCRVVLDRAGSGWTTDDLSRQLGRWMQDGRDVALIVGGPEGLAPECRERAEQRWSLSPLTLPHPVVRILVAEQLYRAWSVLHGHPYHR